MQEESFAGSVYRTPNPALFTDVQRSAAREEYRQAIHPVIARLGRIVAHELRVKLETLVSLDWTELRASELSDRARAFQSVAASGMDDPNGCGNRDSGRRLTEMSK